MGWGQSGSLGSLCWAVLWGKALVTLFLVTPHLYPHAQAFPEHTCQLLGCFRASYLLVASVTVEGKAGNCLCFKAEQSMCQDTIGLSRASHNLRLPALTFLFFFLSNQYGCDSDGQTHIQTVLNLSQKIWPIK